MEKNQNRVVLTQKLETKNFATAKNFAMIAKFRYIVIFAIIAKISL